MDRQLQLSRLQRLRTRAFLLLSALRKRLTLGVRAVLLDGGRVLLVKHTYVPGWHLPGGGVEPGETAEASAAREVSEETGYAVDGRPALLGFYLNLGAGGARDHVAVYVWREFRPVRAFTPNFEIAQCQWFELGALPDDIDPGTARRLREITERLVPAAQW